jgi:hypothetical protein
LVEMYLKKEIPIFLNSKFQPKKGNSKKEIPNSKQRINFNSFKFQIPILG